VVRVIGALVALLEDCVIDGPVTVLQTDGGSEFKAGCAEGMSRLAERHRIARAYKKNEQAFIEAFNGTLRREEFGHDSSMPTNFWTTTITGVLISRST